MWKTGHERHGSKRSTMLALALSAFITLGGCSLLPREEEPLLPPLVEPVQINETVEEVATGAIQLTLTGPGRLESTRNVYHQLSESGGRIKEVFVRAGDVVETGEILIQLDDSGLDIERLEHEIEAAKKQKELRQALESDDDEQIRIAGLDYQLAQARLLQTEQKIEASQIRSQISGIVTFVTDMKPGDHVEAYTTLIIVSDPNELELVYGNATQGQNLSSVQVGMHADLTYDNRELVGTVVQTPRSAPYTDDERLREEYSRTLRITVNDLPPDAEPGDQMNVSIVLAEKEDVIVIPKTALRNMFGRTFVQVLDGEKRRELDVEIGIETATQVEIVNGLEPGQKVVLR